MTMVIESTADQAFEMCFEVIKGECEPYPMADAAAVKNWLRENTDFATDFDIWHRMRDQVLHSARAVGQIAHILLELEPVKSSRAIEVGHVQHAFFAVREHCRAGLPATRGWVCGKP